MCGIWNNSVSRVLHFCGSIIYVKLDFGEELQYLIGGLYSPSASSF